MKTIPDDVPRWFLDFAVENQKQHGELAKQVIQSEARLIRWIVSLGVASVGVVVAATGIVVGVVIAVS